MKPKTHNLARQVQLASAALPPNVLFSIVNHALTAVGDHDGLEWEDALRFQLGWVLKDDQGRRYTAWPDTEDLDVDWLEPTPTELADRLAQLDVAAFYHTVLPIFSEWPDLSDAAPPSSYSDGYHWMQSLTHCCGIGLSTALSRKSGKRNLRTNADFKRSFAPNGGLRRPKALSAGVN